jgi:fumarylacetoacetase
MKTTDPTHDPRLASWVASADGHPDFPIQNLPLGVFQPPGEDARIGVAIGDCILDLRAAARAGLLPASTQPAAREPVLNTLLGLPASERRALRATLSRLLSDRAHENLIRPMLFAAEGCRLLNPARIGDYTDFYVGINHAVNVGRLFRPDQPLMPNYKYVPIGYHGRASSVRPSGEPVVRPRGQVKSAPDAPPTYVPSGKLDYELELGLWVGPGNGLGQTIPIGEALEHFAGACILNDWSARDVQAWEYQPLGPFLGKNFHTTISPWVVTAEALAPFWIAQPPRAEGDPEPLAYLSDPEDQAAGALAIELELSLSTPRMREAGLAPEVISRAGADTMYWTVAQIFAHHASGGCNLQPGDLIGTGTLSGTTREAFGSLLEITGNGKQPLSLPSGETRAFLEDGDEVVVTARASAPGAVSIGFGECRAVILPSPAEP